MKPSLTRLLSGFAIVSTFTTLSALTQDKSTETEITRVRTEDHLVPHTSTMPANEGDLVHLFVRERFAATNKSLGKPVLMVHGRSVPALAGFEVKHDEYDWALALAKAGMDVFMVDLQGAGRSPRPKMDNPCNVPDAQQNLLLTPYQLPVLTPEGAKTCKELQTDPNFPEYRKYPFRLALSSNEWSELDTVIEYIRQLRGVEKVALVSWSRGSLVAGPYTVQHPEKVESLFLLAPIFNPNAVPGLPYLGPAAPAGFDPPVKPGTDSTGRAIVIPCTRAEVMSGACAGVIDRKLEAPENAANPTMTLTPRNNIVDAQGRLLLEGLMGRWNRELQCENQRDDAIQDVIWRTVMENDELGRTWGAPPAGAPAGSPPEGVIRVRSFVPWGWNTETASNVHVPVLLIFGELDTEGRAEGFPVAVNSSLLYDTLPGSHKLLFKVGCAGHFMPWERQAKVLHQISKQWLKHGAVEDFTSGKFFVDAEGNLLPIGGGTH